jgi:hypothetical protein
MIIVFHSISINYLINFLLEYFNCTYSIWLATNKKIKGESKEPKKVAKHPLRGTGCTIQSRGDRIQGARCIRGAWVHKQDAGCRIQGIRHRIQGARDKIASLWHSHTF